MPEVYFEELEKRVGKSGLGVSQLKCFLQVTIDLYITQLCFTETQLFDLK